MTFFCGTEHTDRLHSSKLQLIGGLHKRIRHLLEEVRRLKHIEGSEAESARVTASLAKGKLAWWDCGTPGNPRMAPEPNLNFSFGLPIIAGDHFTSVKETDLIVRIGNNEVCASA